MVPRVHSNTEDVDPQIGDRGSGFPPTARNPNNDVTLR